MMICPYCQEDLEKTIFYGVEIDHCPKCLGLWLEENELELAKDKKDEDLKWLDIDLWKDKKKFNISPAFTEVSTDKLQHKLCPFCRLPLYEVSYGDSGIDRAHKNLCAPVKIDLCNLCSGIWLDRGEFKKIIEYLRKRKDYEVLDGFSKRVIKEFWEIFIGPGPLREDISDFLSVLKILVYKFSAQHPTFIKIIASLPSK